EVLRRDAPIGLDDNLFALGADSILLIKIAHQAAQAGIRLSALDLFEHPTIALLTERGLAAFQSVPAEIARGADTPGQVGRFPTTAMQRLMISAYDRESDAAGVFHPQQV